MDASLEAWWLAERLAVAGDLSWDWSGQRLGVKWLYDFVFLVIWGGEREME